MANIAAHRQEIQMQRERDKQAAEQRILQEKERITTEIIDHAWLVAVSNGC
jgi:F0F1-type ATP synthase membrane subunit b/b'